MIVNKRYETTRLSSSKSTEGTAQHSVFKEHFKKNHELIKTHKISFFIV